MFFMTAFCLRRQNHQFIREPFPSSSSVFSLPWKQLLLVIKHEEKEEKEHLQHWCGLWEIEPLGILAFNKQTLSYSTDKNTTKDMSGILKCWLEQWFLTILCYYYRPIYFPLQYVDNTDVTKLLYHIYAKKNEVNYTPFKKMILLFLKKKKL